MTRATSIFQMLFGILLMIGVLLHFLKGKPSMHVLMLSSIVAVSLILVNTAEIDSKI